MNECKNCKYAIPFPKGKGYACKNIEVLENLNKDMAFDNDFCKYFKAKVEEVNEDD